MRTIKLMNLLLIGIILVTVVLISCDKDDDPTPENPNYSEEKGEFKDTRDSKVYNWVKIGNQIWMAENLNYTGSGIQHITDNSEWYDNSDYDGWCYYDNNENYADTYGILYQWEAAKTACPEGWHLPTDEEWTQLENYLKENGYSYNGIVGNEKVAKSLATDYGWEESTELGAVGNTDYSEMRNKTGFSALPGGLRFYDGSFFSLDYVVYWWSATEHDSGRAYDRNLFYDNAKVNRYINYKSNGLSVRCLRD